ncbi:hypothetical protein M2451_003185 [Dysgonomonas sp. PFB1-18]|uniref:hypothetical protein n=1 Tax=unclassified Dysgonomonas TaxID=2630389 RepID=UPI0024751170|nr:MULTISPECIES: hypothetical protein [unclassified Dysgonomonas]MDH6310224.1 hypothetical protein [Dysgonomonas sp. PF1-14]MDH6340043.1 hypothetical protein [Dysgonomonas sp. PF1-16]MDH6381850.1 hypothetical protein [Dysgonomonas sp. PFB1-18]MDH6398908.1 hypothetical protein [Dysgonomonas sp. PF1-23]
MTNIFGYFISKNKETYREIAKKEQMNPLRVYLLAHGMRVKSDKDHKVIHSLIEKGIVSGWHG